MFTAAGFAKALAYWKLFLQGVVCTVCLSFLTVLFGFLLALLITGMRMSDFRPFRALALTRDGHERDEGFLQPHPLHRVRLCRAVPRNADGRADHARVLRPVQRREGPAGLHALRLHPL